MHESIAPPAPLDATLQDTDGEERLISSYRGKPAVLFYEDRDSADVNRALKTRLFARAKAEKLLEAAWVLPVANLEGFNWFPARNFALSAVKDAQLIAGVPILIDWTGSLSRAPWGLSGRTSSVVLLDREGREAWKASGRLTAAQIEDLLGRLQRLL